MSVLLDLQAATPQPPSGEFPRDGWWFVRPATAAVIAILAIQAGPVADAPSPPIAAQPEVASLARRPTPDVVQGTQQSSVRPNNDQGGQEFPTDLGTYQQPSLLPGWIQQLPVRPNNDQGGREFPVDLGQYRWPVPDLTVIRGAVSADNPELETADQEFPTDLGQYRRPWPETAWHGTQLGPVRPNNDQAGREFPTDLGQYRRPWPETAWHGTQLGPVRPNNDQAGREFPVDLGQYRRPVPDLTVIRGAVPADNPELETADQEFPTDLRPFTRPAPETAWHGIQLGPVRRAAPIISSIVVLPGAASTTVGGTVQFTASASDQFGDPIAAIFDWTATGGSIDANGRYSASQAGTFVVTATAQGTAVSGTATVAVTAAVVSGGGGAGWGTGGRYIDDDELPALGSDAASWKNFEESDYETSEEGPRVSGLGEDPVVPLDDDPPSTPAAPLPPAGSPTPQPPFLSHGEMLDLGLTAGAAGWAHLKGADRAKRLAYLRLLRQAAPLVRRWLNRRRDLPESGPTPDST